MEKVNVRMGTVGLLALGALAQAAESVPGEYVVRFTDATEAKAFQSLVDTRWSALRAETGLSQIEPVMEDEGIYFVKVDAALAQAGVSVQNLGLRSAQVEPNYIYQVADATPLTSYNDPMIAKQWGLPKVHFFELPVLQSAAQITVAVIDTGVDYQHADLSARIFNNTRETAGNGSDDDSNGYVDDIRGWNAIDSTGNPMDDHGHGTHCAGVIAAQPNNSEGIVGVTSIAPGVRVLPVRFMGKDGRGSLATAIKGIDYARKMGARILSNSWGGTAGSASLQAAIAATEKADILFVAAAGNDSLDLDSRDFFPAKYKNANILSVAATDSEDKLVQAWPGREIGDGSNFGRTTVHVAAPGYEIYSTIPGGKYKLMSGTSMATPLVAGIAANLLTANPKLSATQLKKILIDTSEKNEDLSTKVISGGRVSALAAYREALR